MADEKQVNEALARIDTLVKECGLNPKVGEYFKQGKLYYSYITGGGFIGSIDTITYDPRYAKAVKQFESEFRDCMVYHVIETRTHFGLMLSMLYVGPDEDEWEGQRLDGHDIIAYVFNVDEPDCSDIGYIRVDGFGGSGALVRVN